MISFRYKINTSTYSNITNITNVFRTIFAVYLVENNYFYTPNTIKQTASTQEINPHEKLPLIYLRSIASRIASSSIMSANRKAQKAFTFQKNINSNISVS